MGCPDSEWVSRRALRVAQRGTAAFTREGWLAAARAARRAGVRVFLDEVTSFECVNGSIASDELHRQRCAGLNPAYYPASLAHHHAVQQGRMRVLECDWPKGYKDKDGICLAELL